MNYGQRFNASGETITGEHGEAPVAPTVGTPAPVKGEESGEGADPVLQQL